MRKLTIFSFLLKLGKSSFEPVRHLVGKHDDEKPWRFYVKKYTEGICDFDKTRNDCAECVNVRNECKKVNENSIIGGLSMRHSQQAQMLRLQRS